MCKKVYLPYIPCNNDLELSRFLNLGDNDGHEWNKIIEGDDVDVGAGIKNVMHYRDSGLF
jgi:hypothetical protein